MLQIMGHDGDAAQSPPRLNGETAEILGAVERGEISVQEAVRRLEGLEPMQSAAPPARHPARPRRWWWALPLAAAMLGGLGAWLAWLGGWAWVVAIPCLMLAGLMALLAALTWRAPWLQLRVATGRDHWPRTIHLLLPLPLGLLAWALKRLPKGWHTLDGTALDEIMLALEGVKRMDAPLVIQVDQSHKGEKIEIILG
jgi:hypothetical protein